ncbi:hypothetical protein [Candidatus Contubernalis alkaliaceticus]|uniref:hypothetical protein n=1 Tax=Candidatus Contubernalis alkaliaceticus TaxID=338645 RepID=UPI001F4C04EB|nr:hypothetical protein [Candidatus Contubernalis alkalaceticus]UNC92209.1 hypothetical protein HUE98_08975 [Candidatus Contubernalis alkalaceticus]
MGNEVDLLEVIDKEALERCEFLESNPDAYVERIETKDWYGLVAAVVVSAIVLALGWV